MPEPEVKIAARNMFYDETGKKVRTKKEITDSEGNIRKGCSVIKKGEVYEQHLFGIKNPRFKGKEFLAEAKEFYTDLINLHIKEPEKHLKVFDGNSVYLPTKKIGKNNPKAAEIKADNAARQEWNQTADVALVSGVPEEKIIEVKHEDIQKTASESVKKEGWLPGLFRTIVHKAKEKLQGLIYSMKLPPKPLPEVDLDVYNGMVRIYKALTKERDAADKLRSTLTDLSMKRQKATGIFKVGERKQLDDQIARAEKLIDKHEKAIDKIVRKVGYPDVQNFMRTLERSRDLVVKYEQELKDWKEEVAAIKEGRQPHRKLPKAPEKKSVREQLTRLKKEAQEQPRQKKAPRRPTQDLER